MTSRAGVFNYDGCLIIIRSPIERVRVPGTFSRTRATSARFWSGESRQPITLWQVCRARGESEKRTSPPDDGSGKVLDKRRVATIRISKAWRFRVPRPTHAASKGLQA